MRTKAKPSSAARRWVIIFGAVVLMMVGVCVVTWHHQKNWQQQRALDIQYSEMLDRLDGELETINSHTNPSYVKALESSVAYRENQLTKFTNDYQKKYGEKPIYIKPKER